MRRPQAHPSPDCHRQESGVVAINYNFVDANSRVTDNKFKSVSVSSQQNILWSKMKSLAHLVAGVACL